METEIICHQEDYTTETSVDYTCLYCEATFKNEKYLEIHSFLHSDNDKEVPSVFSLSEVDSETEIPTIGFHIGKHSTDFIFDIATMMDLAKHFKSVKPKTSNKSYSSPVDPSQPMPGSSKSES